MRSIKIALVLALSFAAACGGQAPGDDAQSENLTQPTVVASNLDIGDFNVDRTLAVRGKNAFFANSHSKTLTKVVLKTGVPSIIAKGTGSDTALVLAANATDLVWADLYYASQNGVTYGQIRKIPIAGGNATTIAQEANLSDVVVDDANVYWASPSVIKKRSLSGGDFVKVATPSVSPNTGVSLAVTGTTVIWTDSQGVHKKPAGAAATTLWSPFQNTHGGSPIVADASSVYFYVSNYIATMLAKVPLSGGPVTYLAKLEGNVAIAQIVLDGAYAYFRTTNNTGSAHVDPSTSEMIWRVAVKGGAAKLLVRASPSYGAPMSFALDSTSIYWLTTRGQSNHETTYPIGAKLMKLAK